MSRYCRVSDLTATCTMCKSALYSGLFHSRYSDTHGTIYYLSVSRTVCFPQCTFSHVMYKTALYSRAFCTMGKTALYSRAFHTLLPALYFLTSHVQVLPCLRSYCHLYHVQDCLVLKAFFVTLPAVYRVTDLIVTCSLVPCAKLPCTQGLFHLRYSDTHGTIYYLSVSRTVCFPQCRWQGNRRLGSDSPKLPVMTGRCDRVTEQQKPCFCTCELYRSVPTFFTG